jgi:hypothetical protein
MPNNCTDLSTFSYATVHASSYDEKYVTQTNSTAPISHKTVKAFIMACQTFTILLRLPKRSNTSASLRNVCCLAASGTLERRQRLKIASGEPRDEARALLTITLARTHSSHTQRITPLSLMSERVEYARAAPKWLNLLYNIY